MSFVLSIQGLVLKKWLGRSTDASDVEVAWLGAISHKPC